MKFADARVDDLLELDVDVDVDVDVTDPASDTLGILEPRVDGVQGIANPLRAESEGHAAAALV